jgi:DNA-binding NtrC family response regulator
VDDTELQPRALERSLDLAAGEEHFELPIGEARSLYVEAFEKRYLTAVLRRAQQNVAQAARLAGLDRTHLHRLLAKHGIERLR